MPRRNAGVLVLTLLLLGLLLSCLPAGAADPEPAAIDPRGLPLTLGDLPAGFAVESDQTSFSTSPDGRATAVAAFSRPPDGSGLVLVRSTVHSLPTVEAAVSFFQSLPGVLASQGFNEVPAPLVGDESDGYISPDIFGGQPVVYHTIVYRQASFVVLTTLVGPPRATNEEQTAELARRVSGRISAALKPDPAGPGPVSQTAPASSGTVAEPAPVLQRFPGGPGLLLSAPLADAPEIGSNLRLGGFSGLVAVDQSGTRYAVVTDRGPNVEQGKKKNARLIFPAPEYSPSIVLLEVRDNQLRVVDRTSLKLAAGNTDPITGTREVSGITNSERDGEPWDRAARERLPFDPNGLDTEGLAFDSRDGSYWVCEEYGPSILHVAADGTILYRLVPQGLKVDAPAENVRPMLPADLARRKENRGFEGIGISRDGRVLFAMMQSPLSNPDEKTGEASRNVRLLTIDIANSSAPVISGMYLYQTESGRRVGTEQDDVKVGDVAALDANRVLVAERDNTDGGRHKMVYLADLSRATNLIERKAPKDQSYEEMSDSELKSAGIKPATKTALVDLAAHGYSPQKLEGLALVDEQTIAAINDNDYGIAGLDANGQTIASGVETRLVLIRLEQPIR